MVSSAQRFLALIGFSVLALSLAHARGFLPAVNYNVGSAPVSMVAADFNGDRKPDLAIVNFKDGTVSVLLGRGDGTFRRAKTFTVGNAPSGIAAADFSGDGRPDLVVTNGGDNILSIFMNNGQGGFDVAPPIPSGGIQPLAVAALDLNGDGIADIAAVNGSNDDPNQAGVSILIGNGDGTFRDGVLYHAGLVPVRIATGDLNGDGTIDLAVANFGGGVSILLGNGDGTFKPATIFDSDNGLQGIACSDFNNDGILDLVVANFVQNVSVMLGNGDGTFQNPVDYAAGYTPDSVTISDINGDGESDLAVSTSSRQGLGKVKVLLGNGDGTFRPKWHILTAPGPVSIVAADFNRDHAPDLATADVAANSVSVLMNSGGTHVSDSSSVNPSQFGQPVTFKVTVKPSFPSVGAPTGLVNFYDGATLLGKVPLDDTGQASLTTSGLTVGTHTIKTHYSGDSNFNPNHAKPISQIVT